ncbi:enoyl-CoA hydratase-related protein [Bacteriovorax sp. Seq25_V]|uniref:enoyl-CoA hydratase-related protein n=1 Tax=Bacteriovorax sp. Seq25_V TaxID=1201288 RepID=UPI00038A303A|nr:enoyl-CoA hydratase-related protein [Bacteriovorax sp. Seq25_V]EQC44061.1 enoyl-CoA hydratase/isomerase family protein [Bacteriovorax sp. Seq25_V]
MTDLYKKTLDTRGVATITLNRPEIHNAFNDELILGLIKEFKEMDADPSVKLVVLTGEGKSFCAGADLNWMKKMVSYTLEENIADSMNLANLFEVTNFFSKPIIGKINGAALGGGSGLVAVCDHVVAHESALFGFTEARLGLVPAVISPYVIAKIGHSNARTLFLSGKRFDAVYAKSIGLVHDISLDRYFEKDIQTTIEEFLKSSPAAQVESKKLIFGVESRMHSLEDRKKFTCETIAKMRISEQGQEGMNALLEKRKPNWLES